MEVFTVSQITEILKRTMEDGFSDILVEGEISNWKAAPSGHFYFSLKDRNAMLQAVMFRGKAMHMDFKPADGSLVRARGQLSVYPARGQYQLIVSSMSRAGDGEILLAMEELKRKLAAEGLFDAERKKPIPPFPGRVVVITSPTGAAIRDVLNILGRRAPHIRIRILPSSVQGAEAAAQMIRQLELANSWELGDVIILGRGGGSLEDLLAFSDEALVRAVAASAIPVISAVGHETDFSLCDFAADLRAPTPSAAAELVSESSESIMERLELAGETLATMMRARIERGKFALSSFSPEDMEMRLERIMQPLRQAFDEATDAIAGSMRERLVLASHRLSTINAVLEASDPMAILERGFAVVRPEGSKEAIRDAGKLKEGQKVSISFARGKSIATIGEVIK